MKQILQQSEQEFSALFQSYQGFVRAVLFKLNVNESLDDLTQEVFLKVWKGLSGFRSESHIKTWIARITYNVAQDFFRKKRTDIKAVGLEVGAEERLSEKIIVKSLENGVLGNKSTGESATGIGLGFQKSFEQDYSSEEFVMKALALLPIEQRVVIVLVVLEEMTMKEAAEVLKIPEGTVKSRLHLARKKLYEHLTHLGVQI